MGQLIHILGEIKAVSYNPFSKNAKLIKDYIAQRWIDWDAGESWEDIEWKTLGNGLDKARNLNDVFLTLKQTWRGSLNGLELAKAGFTEIIKNVDLK